MGINRKRNENMHSMHRWLWKDSQLSMVIKGTMYDV